jgi:phage shock protein A
MLKKLKDAIDSALSALEAKAGEAPAEDIAKLLDGMRKELIENKASIPVLEQTVQKLRRSHERELAQADDCHRRAMQAQSIGDEETVEVALRFEAKHRVAVDVWVQKIEAAEAELAMQRQTVVDMTEELKTAISRRDVLAIQARRAGTTGRMRGGERSAADEFDRLVNEIEREEDLGSAERAVEHELDPDQRVEAEFASTDFDDHSSRGLSREELAELQLEELKRRMEEDGD